MGYVFVLRIMLYGLSFVLELCRFEDSAEFPRCTLYISVSAYIKNGLCFAFICALLERSGEIVVKLRVGTHCEVSPSSTPSPADLGCYIVGLYRYKPSA